MTMAEMLSMFFINDVSNGDGWRLKGHAESEFWKFIGSWVIMLRNPSDIGFADDKFKLPELIVLPELLKDNSEKETLFSMPVSGFQEINKSRKESLADRIEKTKQLIAKKPNEQFLVWCDYNDESNQLAKIIPDSIEVKGADSLEHKEKSMLDFSAGKIKVLITKPKIAGFGMNWQNCHNVIFCGLSYSYESYYQSIRRCWRFGQKENVNVHIIISEKELSVLNTIKEKQERHQKMSDNIINNVKSFMDYNFNLDYSEDKTTNDKFETRLGDSCERIKEIETESIDYSIFSPPFSSLYTYSNSERDMGNCKSDDEFYEHFIFLAKELYRITKKGRLLSFHCMLLPTVKYKDGFTGLKDFRGDLIRIFQKEGFIYHSEVVIWKDPVIAMQRTKALGLLHKQLKKDASLSRQGIPDYLITMRKEGDNEIPIKHTNDDLPVDLWQKYASPIWTDINQSKTLQKTSCRDEKDEKHICPLQLEVIERALHLWTNKGDTVFSPFMGIGSEGYQALLMDRKFSGIELKKSYYEQAVKNLLSVADIKRQNNLL
jgi:DNA modification methylase